MDAAHQLNGGFWLLMSLGLFAVSWMAGRNLLDALHDHDWRSMFWALIGTIGALMAAIIFVALGLQGFLSS